MDTYIKTIGGTLVALVLLMSMSGFGKDYRLILGVLVCCMIFGIAVAYLSPVIAFIQDLESLIPVEHDLLEIVIKTTGIGMIGQIAAGICEDSGSKSIGKGVQYFTCIMILYISMPLFQLLLNMLKEILEGL